jgi:hypothetical protein
MTKDAHEWRYSSADATNHAYLTWILRDLGIRNPVAACGARTSITNLSFDIDAEGQCCENCQEHVNTI